MFEDSTHGGRQRNRAGCVETHHFNSRPHGGRQSLSQEIDVTKAFQLTPSRRATSTVASVLSTAVLFQLTPSRRATQFFHRSTPPATISTHALTEGDPPSVPHFSIAWYISTHALTEGDLMQNTVPDPPGTFQLTPSRRATLDIYTYDEWFLFQLTPSRRATGLETADRKIYRISTHALTEGDILTFSLFRALDAFQLTPSRRATIWICLLNYSFVFQLTPSRRATQNFFHAFLA